MDQDGDQETGFWQVTHEEQAGSKLRLVKLKISKIESPEETIGIGDERDGFDHICVECGKEYKSGKALGGHKRIHMQETERLQPKPKIIIPIGSYGGDRSAEKGVSCCVCGKKFSSMKALYGHMRFHPDRGWRGIQPPPRPNSLSSSLSEDQQINLDTCSDYSDDSHYWNSDSDAVFSMVDLKESIKGWSVTGKRGRRSSLQENANPEEDMQEAVDELLTLASGEQIRESDERNNLAENFEKPENKVVKRKKKKRRSSNTEKDDNGGEFLDHGNVIMPNCREKHVCVTCDKSFASHQALGGHRASHSKPKMEPSHSTPHISENDVSGQGSNTSVHSNGDHRCNICQKRFLTGQALGGHKRCHWVGPIEADSSSNQKTEAQKTFDIDLNELPREEVDEILQT